MNKKDIVAYLEQLDLPELEAKLYLTLLETGPISVKELAESVDVKRTTAYAYIDELIEKGLIIRLVKGSKKMVTAIDPKDSLQRLVEEKLDAAKKVQEEFPKMLKLMTTSIPQAKQTNDAEIRYYKGRAGVKKIYEEAIHAQELRSYVNIEEILEVFPENAQLFDNTINHNPDMIMFEIVENSPQAKQRIELANKNVRSHYKIFPDDIKITSTDILIYDEKVCFVNLKENINGVVLHNKDLYNNFKLLFDLIWRLLPENNL